MVADDTTPSDPDDHIVLTTRAEAFAELEDLNAPETPESDVPDGAVDDASGEFASAPPIVAVMVVHNAGEWLDESLRALGNQTYENLSVLVIDAASDIDPTPRVARVLPGAFVRRLEHNVGFGPTLNEILELVSGAAFFCLCHDDVALDPSCVRRLVEEAFRSNAGIVGPKLVDWDDPEVLLDVGFTVDKSAGRAPYAEWGELDQGQHDAVRDVFAVSGGCTLVRADLFEHLGGFDPHLDLLGEDLDLCWRTHLVGGRVVVAPQARARHRQALADRVDVERLIRVDAAHRIRTALTNYRFAHLCLLLPQILVISLVEAIVETSIGRRAQARAQLAAWGTNLRELPGIMRARRNVARIREHNDRSIRRLQTHTWARLDGIVQAHRRAGTAADLGFVPDESEGMDEPGTGTGAKRSLVGWGVIAVVAVVVLGTRELFFGALPPIGSFARVPGSVGDLWRAWLSSWNPMGLGSSQSPAAGLAPMALVGSIFGGALGFLRRVMILLPLPIGLFGAWHLARPTGSRRAQLVALVVYAAVPVPWNAFAQGRLGGLLLYATAPWLVHACAQAMQVEPFVASPSGRSRRRWWSRLLGMGLLLAVVGSLVPAVAGVAVVIAVGLALGSLATGRVGGLARLMAVVIGGVAVAAVLLLPWTAVGPARSLSVLAGMRSGSHGWLDLGQILRFQSGPMGAGFLGYALLIVAALPLALGRSWRFRWAVRGWGVALTAWAVVWLGQQRWFDLVVPPPEVLLAPAAIGLALAAACGMVAIEVDLRAYRFGWAQAASVLAGVALVLTVLPVLGTATDGRWKMAPVGLDEALSPVVKQQAGQSFRVVWAGDPDTVPVAGWSLGDTLTVGVSDNGMPTLADLWAPADPQGSRALLDALRLAMDGQTTRVGRVLADMGVRYLVLPRQVVPMPYRSTAHPLPDKLLNALDDQLDLARVPANDAVVVYQNDAWRPGATLWPAGTPHGHSVADALDASGGRSTLRRLDSTRTTRGVLPSAGILAIHEPVDSHWRLTVDGRAARPVTLWGWEQGFVVPHGGRASLRYESGPSRTVVLVLVALAWVVVIAAWLLSRRRSGVDELTAPVDHVDADEGTLVQVSGGDGGGAEVVVDEVRVGDEAGSDDHGPARDAPDDARGDATRDPGAEGVDDDAEIPGDDR